VFGAKDVQGLQTRHVGQMVIEQHQIQVRMFLRQGKRLAAITGLQHHHVFVQTFEDLVQPFTHQGVVVDHKYFHGGAV
jgi:hypothetical protein